METDDLIRRLAETSGPVLRLPAPAVRAAVWFALAIPYVGLVVLVMLPRSDLATKVSEPAYLIEQLAALATGITASLAAFASVVPGSDRRILIMPAFPFALWLGSLGLGCIQSWFQFGAEGLSLHPDWYCFPAIILVGLVPAIAMALMLRRGAPLTPHVSTALGGLAAAGLGNFGLRLFHTQDASLMVLVWQVGTVVVLTIFAGSAGRLLLDWRFLTGDLRQRLSSHSTPGAGPWPKRNA
jgi:hypothetical protein